MFYYTYKLTHKTSGQFYYGSRKSKIEPINDLGIRYKSSSRYIQQIGFDNFNYEIINLYNSYEECYWEEQRIIKESICPLILNRGYYDRELGHKMFSTNGFKHTPEAIEKIKEKRAKQVMPKCSQKTKDKISKSKLGKSRPQSVKDAVGRATSARKGGDLAKQIGQKAKKTREERGTMVPPPTSLVVCRLRDRKLLSLANFVKYP